MNNGYLPFETAGMEKLPMVDADITLYQQIALDQPYDELLHELIDHITWRQEEVTIYGKTHLQPRLSAWYGDKQLDYSYSGITLQPQPWSQTLVDLKTRIESLVGQGFNSVLLNYYRDHRDSMGMHSDDEAELGKQPMIASLSLGEERTLVFRHRYRKDLNTVKLPLPSGSLLLMKGTTQSYWKHGINKQKKPCGPRLNLTFRNIIKRH
jgi:alkylated DNA repair dioxygenase AlkB